MEIRNALAKDIGVNLIKHNRNVSIASEYIGKQFLGTTNNDLLKIIRIGGLLHDIGKMTEEFQKLLRKETKKTTHQFRHNEIGGAFIYRYFDSKNIKIEYVSSIIYWHHGISNEMNKHYYNDILDQINDQEIEWMKELTTILLDESYILSNPRLENVKTPYFYTDNDEYNENMSIIRSCVVTADRIVSMLEENDISLHIDESNVSSNLDDVLNNRIIKNNQCLINKSFQHDKKRFDNQLEIVSKCDQTTIVKAPGGFGKTLLGLIWSSQTPHKTLWVCPRNVVGESVYKSILDELEMLDLSNKITVELYMTGQVIKSHNGEGGFNSDIIVTNIDNFLTPSYDNNLADRTFLTHSANIVFDEYHEFVSDAAYFASFINLMKARLHNTQSRTLLLSATPIDISHFWNTIGRKTTILPNNLNHYPAIHNKKYLIRVVENFLYDKQGSDIVIFNSIMKSQIYKHKYPNSLLFHSEFIDDVKDEKLQKIMNDFGKKSVRTTDKNTVVATLIARASLDVSFLNLFESCLSPEGTTQSSGRCNRFGDYDEESTITVFRINSKSEDMVANYQYDMDLRDKWFEELLPYNGKKLTLDEFYIIYNTHVLKYAEERKKYFERRRRRSLEKLTKLYPIKYKTKQNTEIKTAGSNKLRSVGNEIFFLVNLHNDKNKYIGPFTSQIYKSIPEDFGENSKVYGRMIASMKVIMSQKNPEFDYSEILKNKDRIIIEDLRKYGKKSNTPYIRYNEVYHPEYGIINETKLNNFYKL